MILNLKQGEYLGDDLKVVENNFFKFSMTAYQPDAVIEKHFHENDYTSILVNGNYWEKSKQEKRAISAGDILFRPKGYTHENQFTAEGGTCFNIEFKPGWTEQADSDFTLPGHFEHFSAGTFPILYTLLVNFQQNGNEDNLLELIVEWVSQFNPPHSSRKRLPWVNKVCEILENERESFHSLRALSERVFICPVYMARAFKLQKGCTVGQYQLKAKLSNAASLLFSTSLPVSDISFRNGFYDDSHFVHAFRSFYKITPQQFRKLVKS